MADGTALKRKRGLTTSFNEYLEPLDCDSPDDAPWIIASPRLAVEIEHCTILRVPETARVPSQFIIHFYQPLKMTGVSYFFSSDSATVIDFKFLEQTRNTLSF